MAIVMVFSILPTFVFAETGDTFTVEAMSGNMDKPVPVTYRVLTEDASGGMVAVAGQGSNPAIPTDTTSLVLPNTVTNNGKIYTVTEIGESDFEGCTSLNWINLPKSLTKIGVSAFEGAGLGDIDIPNSVTSIGDNAFKDCYNLDLVISGSKTPAQLGNDVFANYSPDLRIEIPNGTSEAYVAKGWPEDCLAEGSLFEGKILDTYSNPIEGATVSIYDKSGNFKGSVETNENGYFDANDYVEYSVEQIAKIEKDGYMTMSINFTPIESGAVMNTYYMVALAEYDGGFSANTIEGASITYQILTKDETSRTGTVRIVYGPGSLYDGSITLPNTVTYDGITYTVTEIGDYAFADLLILTSITLPSSLENIGESSFFNNIFLYIISNYEIPAQATDSIIVGSSGSHIYIPVGAKQAYINAGWPGHKLIEIGFYSISGKVVDENGNGISDVMLTISNDDGYAESMHTDSDGNYDFTNCIGNKSYTIKAQKDGYTESVANIDLAESDVTDFDIVITSLYPDIPEGDNLPDSPTVPTNNPVTPTNNANNPQTSINNTPQTGYSSQYVIYIAFGCMLMAILAAGCLVIKKKS